MKREGGQDDLDVYGCSDPTVAAYNCTVSSSKSAFLMIFRQMEQLLPQQQPISTLDLLVAGTISVILQ